MALASTTVWEVRTTGSDPNGGGFNPSRAGAGADRSQQDAAHVVIDGTTISATVHTTTTQITLVGYTVSDTAGTGDRGNVVQITGGTATAGFYEITAADVANNRWTLDRAPGTAGQTVVGSMGGALATMTKAKNSAVAGNTIYQAPGNYATGAIDLTTVASLDRSNPLTVIGYGAGGRADRTSGPVLLANAASITVLRPGNCIYVENVTVNANGNASVTGFNVDFSQGRVSRCTAVGCATGFTSNNGASVYADCLADTCGTGFAGSGVAIGCVSKLHTSIGFGCGAAVDCIAYGGTGSATGFRGSVQCTNCTAYGNASHGFWLFSAPAFARNCISYGNGGYGFGEVYAFLRVQSCAYGGNTSGNLNGTPSALSAGNVSLTGDPFTNAAAGDFGLNNTAGAGAACRAAGIPGAFPGGTTTGYPDLGAVQHQDSGGGTSVVRTAGIRRGGLTN